MQKGVEVVSNWDADTKIITNSGLKNLCLVGAFSVIVKTDGSFAAQVRIVTVVRIVSRMDSSKSVKYPKCD